MSKDDIGDVIRNTELAATQAVSELEPPQLYSKLASIFEGAAAEVRRIRTLYCPTPKDMQVAPHTIASPSDGGSSQGGIAERNLEGVSVGFKVDPSVLGRKP